MYSNLYIRKPGELYIDFLYSSSTEKPNAKMYNGIRSRGQGMYWQPTGENCYFYGHISNTSN